jgi:tRNA G18 (ribose-2'-O)-methylase SpoU
MPSARALCERLAATPAAAAIALDRVTNPHNLGAVVRSAAYFGADGVLYAHGDGPARLPPAAVRVAEGGAECVPIAAVERLAPALAFARARGVRVVGTDARARDDAFSLAWPRPCIVVVGNEREGLSRDVRPLCDATVAIPGTGRVESLNASVAAGVVLAELARTRPR